MIVDSSSPPMTPPGEPSVRVIGCAPGTSVGVKRNLALDAARGTLVTWFDDDDWQHPRKLSLLVAALGASSPMAGPRSSWFVDLDRGRARRHDGHHGVLFNGLAARREAIGDVRFDEQRPRAADTAWVAAVQRHMHARARLVPELLFFWLCHTQNLSNPATRYVFPNALADVRHAVGKSDWGATDDQLEQLRTRLADAAR